MVKLTMEFIETEIEPPQKGQRFYRDDDVRGFAVRATLRSKSYILEKRVAGKNRRITIGGCDAISLEAAKKRACIMIGEIAKGIDPETGKRTTVLRDITLKEVLQKFLEVKKNRESTKRNYSSIVNRHLAEWLELPIAAITKDMVEERHRELCETPTKKGTPGHGRADSTMKCLRSLINFASDRFGTDGEPLLSSNAVARLSINGAWLRVNRRQRMIPDSKIKAWYSAVASLSNDSARDLLVFLLLSGMRVGETKQLQWSHVNFEELTVTVPRELTKSDREHQLPLSDFIAAMLKRRHIYRGNSKWVFPSTRNRFSHLAGHSGIVRRVSELSGVKFACHDLRRTFATTAEKLGVPSYGLQRLLNHSLSDDVTGGYMVYDIDRLRSYMNKISNAFVKLFGINETGRKPLEPIQVIEAIQLKIDFDNL